ncbi:hypothetical protein NUKP76_03670 [Klebsiella variicola]|nr:hypothetical protein NUKP42_25540 [Klebsiella variicola]GKM90479.1 hypothetical protein NUKP76_03670 [Klebsiella variicola]
MVRSSILSLERSIQTNAKKEAEYTFITRLCPAMASDGDADGHLRGLV